MRITAASGVSGWQQPIKSMTTIGALHSSTLPVFTLDVIVMVYVCVLGLMFDGHFFFPHGSIEGAQHVYYDGQTGRPRGAALQRGISRGWATSCEKLQPDNVMGINDFSIAEGASFHFVRMVDKLGMQGLS